MTKKFRVVIGSDDAGFQYKEILKKQLQSDTNVESVVDVGVDASSKTPYPDIAIAAAQMIADGKEGGHKACVDLLKLHGAS
jgi:ribose 5-phosphate isomerase B